MTTQLEQSRQIDKSCAVERASVEALDDVLGWAFPILDHGFLRVVDYMGCDASIVQAARVSYGRGTKSISDDRGLIRYMISHHHNTPVEQCEIKFHMKLPIFVARQMIRHRTTSVNELSARYSILDNEFYVPDPQHIQPQATDNKQGRSGELTLEQSAAVMDLLKRDANRSYHDYEVLLNERHYQTPTSLGEEDPERIPEPDDRLVDDPEFPGIARELARMNLTLNVYTQWYWKTNLHNLFHFLGLRADSHAQYEIRVYAEKMLDIVKLWVPFAAEAFEDYQHQAKTLSRMDISLVKDLITDVSGTTRRLVVAAAYHNDSSAFESLMQKYGNSKREIRELAVTFIPQPDSVDP